MSKLRNNLSLISLNFMTWGAAIFLLALPFLPFFSITLGSIGTSQGVLLAFVFLWLVYSINNRRVGFEFDNTNVAFIAIAFLSFVVSTVVRPETTPFILGIKNNILPIIALLVFQLPFNKKHLLIKNIQWIVIIPGLIVALLAILQSTIIPPDFLETIGYKTTDLSINTIDPRQTVDGSLKIYRAFSTLGGPNQLGAYLILPFSFVLAYFLKRKKWWALGLSLPILAAILLSFSRSAWLGTIAALIAVVILLANKKQRIYIAIASFFITILAGAVVLVVASQNQAFQNVVMHGRYFENRIEGSDQQRLASLATGLDKVMAKPFGSGLGSAGPASHRSAEPVITENWYLQIALEIGIIGLVLYFIAFSSLLIDFYRRIDEPLAVGLYAATVGILVANLFLHTWADSTISIAMFSLYGIFKGKRL
ncbi:hypothetical protein EXS66_01375 [Candidatus Saccharibacteria bacterium]|nr:hypothetical protein [Candidatus Saccharibacteria bacterium]